MVKIEFDKKTCIGCGACTAVCSDNWDLKNGKAVCKNLNPKDIGCNQDAADACPVNCIKIKK